MAISLPMSNLIPREPDFRVDFWARHRLGATPAHNWQRAAGLGVVGRWLPHKCRALLAGSTPGGLPHADAVPLAPRDQRGTLSGCSPLSQDTHSQPTSRSSSACGVSGLPDPYSFSLNAQHVTQALWVKAWRSVACFDDSLGSDVHLPETYDLSE